MIAMKDDEECLEMAFEQYTLPDHKSQPTSETGHTKNYGAKSSKISSDASFRLFLLVTLSALHSLVVLTLRYTRAGVSFEDLYVINDIVLLTEVTKFFIATAVEYLATNGHLLQSIQENIIERPCDFLRVIIPSLIYLLQNSVRYVAISNLTAPIYEVTFQCKLLTTAVVSVLMLQRRYSAKQWACLVILVVGVSVVVLGAHEESKGGGGKNQNERDGANSENLFLGLIAITVVCLCSAFGGVYFEKVLKRPTSEGGQYRAPVSMWMRNMQMAFFSVCFALLNMMRESDREQSGEMDNDNNPITKPFMHGFTKCVYFVILLQAGGGLLVAAVIKYADNVLKDMATGVSILLSTIVSTFLFGTILSLQFAFGASIIVASVYLFSNDVPCSRCAKSSDEDNEMEMRPMLPS